MASLTYTHNNLTHLYEKIDVYSNNLELIPNTYIYMGYYGDDGILLYYYETTPKYLDTKIKNGKTYKQLNSLVYTEDLTTIIKSPWVLV